MNNGTHDYGTKGTCKLFVYGTLKRGGINHRLLEGSEYLGKASITGYTLIAISVIPIAIHGKAKHKIKGEIYRVNREQYRIIYGMETRAGYSTARQKGMTFFVEDNFRYLGGKYDVSKQITL